jgi:hypothetical protein
MAMTEAKNLVADIDREGYKIAKRDRDVKFCVVAGEDGRQVAVSGSSRDEELLRVNCL